MSLTNSSEEPSPSVTTAFPKGFGIINNLELISPLIAVILKHSARELGSVWTELQ